MSIIIPLRTPERYDLKEPLALWLDEPVQVSDLISPEEFTCLKPDFHSTDCMKELKRLAAVRNCISESILKSEAHGHAVEFGLQDCHEYHAILLAFEERGFPSRDEISPLKLTWLASVPPRKETHGSFIWERVCTLWNIAALESFQASQMGKDKDGRKAAVKHYQNASAAMKYLLEALEGHSEKFDTIDMNKTFIKFWEKVMLAQAQIAVYDMVSTDNQKSSLLSYLAMGAVPVLNDALIHAKDPMIISNLPRHIEEWASECKSQSMLLTARAEFHQATMHRQAKEWGLELARLLQAETFLQKCMDFLKSTNRNFTKVEEVLRLVHDRKTKVKQENDTLYQEDVPDELAAIESKLMAKNDMPMPGSMTKPKILLFSK
eukprot:CAMPEP_0194142142 /NCGR_PEP_ID=MMETSP0152-20130528/11464_1 /TAXON_ID=1049557 /ORGANISM="Thalassiothrix antarctica, Strain L6-D1" /LENGTH=376 /DNA_ID=CAMNT_0038841011 /DNA_START=21 /DNA_END=1151 /DNA_ORIENTATION=-